MNYGEIYHENQLQSSCTNEYYFSIPGSMRAFDRTDLPLTSHYCNHVVLGLVVSCPRLLGTGTISTLCLLETVSTSRLSFRSQRTISSLLFHADSPFFNFFFTIYLGFPLRSPRRVSQMYVFCFERCLASFTEL